MNNFIVLYNYADKILYPSVVSLNKIKYMRIIPLQVQLDPNKDHAIIVKFTDGEERMFCLESLTEAEALFHKVEIYNKYESNYKDKDTKYLDEVLDQKILSEIPELSVRIANCLKNHNILTIRDLVKNTELQMLEIPNFGIRCLNRLKDSLDELAEKHGVNLHFGMKGI